MWDLQQLFCRHSGDLKRYLRRRGVSAETAADLTQEIFLRLLTASPVGPIDNVQAYIFRIANNLSIDLARRQRLLPFLENSEDVLDQLMDEAPSAERVVVSRQELAVLQAALNQVPQTPRSVFLLRLDGRTFEDIGRSIGIPTQTAFSQMLRVMMHLRSALDRSRE